MICAKTDRVAKIIDRQLRHSRVQINDAESPAGGPVKQDIIQLRIVMGDAQRQLPVAKCLQYEPDAVALLRLTYRAIRIVDMAPAIACHAEQRFGKVKRVQYSINLMGIYSTLHLI